MRRCRECDALLAMNDECSDCCVDCRSGSSNGVDTNDVMWMALQRVMQDGYEHDNHSDVFTNRVSGSAVINRYVPRWDFDKERKAIEREEQRKLDKARAIVEKKRAAAEAAESIARNAEVTARGRETERVRMMILTSIRTYAPCPVPRDTLIMQAHNIGCSTRFLDDCLEEMLRDGKIRGVPL